MPLLFSTIRNSIPQTPGVYFFRTAEDSILYIGKAANLRVRLSSYFLKSAALEPAKRRMLREADRVTWQETASEIEALLEEARLIKTHLPRYNIVMRDDKQYLFVGFTKEKFPRIVYTHQPLRKPSGSRKTGSAHIDYMGPFTEAGAVKRLLRSLRSVFPYCTCKKTHARPCQQSELGLCMGVCCTKDRAATPEEYAAYRRNIRFIKNVLAGRQKQLHKRLQTEMNQASKKHDYEHAARLRDQTRALLRIFAHRHVLKKDYRTENQKGVHELKILLGLTAYPRRIEGYDISNIQGNFAVGSMVVFTNGAADKNEYRKFRIRTVYGANDTAMIQEVLTRRLLHTEWPHPDLLLIDGGRGQLNAAYTAAKRAGADNLVIVSIAKREEELYVPGKKTPFRLKEMPLALLYLLQQIRNEAHRFAISYYRTRHRKEGG